MSKRYGGFFVTFASPKVLPFLRPDGSKRQAERGKIQMNLVFRSLIRTFAVGYGSTEFLLIVAERGLRDGSLLAVGIPDCRGAACVCAAEVLCQLSVAQKQAVGAMGGAVGRTTSVVFVWRDSNGHWSEEREGIKGSYRLVSHCHTADWH